MNMREAIAPKSNQLNADDLIGRSLTIRITGVTITPGDQPVAVSFEGDNGKPYRPCKSMTRAMVIMWGDNANLYRGRILILYRDESVKWGGMAVGGIRISHASHIDNPITMALTATRGSKKPFTVRPMPAAPSAAPASDHDPVTGEVIDNAQQQEAASERISAVDISLTAAAMLGWKQLAQAFNALSQTDRDTHAAALEKRHQPAAKAVELARREAAAVAASNAPALAEG